VNELSIHEVLVPDVLFVVVHEEVGVVVFEPLLALVCFLLIETQIDRLVIVVVDIPEE
jgi:hypothetical protein